MIYGPLSTEYYDLVKPNVSPEEIDFYQKKLKDTQGAILDIGCGAGRILLPLLQKGFEVHGVDDSQPMLDRCRLQGKTLGLEPILYKQSVCALSLPQKYKALIILGASFQLIYPRSNAVSTLQLIKAHLAEGGRLFVDSFIPWEMLYENGQEEQFLNTVKAHDGSTITLTSSTLANKHHQFFISTNKYEKQKEGKVLCKEEEEMPVSWYYNEEMVLLLRSVGFNEVIFHNTLIGKDPEVTIYEAVN